MMDGAIINGDVYERVEVQSACDKCRKCSIAVLADANACRTVRCSLFTGRKRHEYVFRRSLELTERLRKNVSEYNDKTNSDQ